VNPQAVIADRIEAFVRTEFDINPSDTGFDRKADLFELGYIDSIGFAELLAFLGEEFGVDIPEDDLLSDDFLRIDGIASIVSRLVGADVRPALVLAEEHLP
jgi:D-alanine--poly(phosphoribitol) ligase subunit 2